MNSDDRKLQILIDTSPLASQHATRGIGMYTRLLLHELEQIEDISVHTSANSPELKNAKADLIHFPFFDFFFSTLPIIVGKPIVVTIHDVIPLKFPAYYKPGIRGLFRFQRQKLVLKTASAIITDSESSKADITYHLGIPKDKIHVVYLAANPTLSQQPESSIAKIKKKYAIPKKYILYVGDINYNKNVPQLIKALKYLPPDIHLVCVGRNFTKQPIPEWQWIETQLALSNVHERTTFVTNLLTDDTTDLAALYSGATCYVQPSLYEGFGLPVLEAMQCKTPVVAAANSSLLEIGRDAVVFTGTSAEELAAGIQDVLQWSEHARKNRISLGFARSLEFSWTTTANETVDVYKHILKK